MICWEHFIVLLKLNPNLMAYLDTWLEEDVLTFLCMRVSKLTFTHMRLVEQYVAR